VGEFGELRFDEPAPDGSSVRVRFDEGSVKATTRIELLDRFEIADFFDELAAAWKGWSGVRTYGSEGVDLALTCRHDGIGHISMYVEISDSMFDFESGKPFWGAAGWLSIEPGSLDATATRLRRLMSQPPGDAEPVEPIPFA
jgi:hypothetical protein